MIHLGHFPCQRTAWKSATALVKAGPVKGLSFSFDGGPQLAEKDAPFIAPNYYEEMFKWILEGSELPPSTEHFSQTALEFLQEYQGKNSFYAPRVSAQLNGVIEELAQNPTTRRACLTILQADDDMIRRGKRNELTKVEYPCTVGLNFYRTIDRLNMQVHMRSNNIEVLFPLDSFVFLGLRSHVARTLNLREGITEWSCWDAHTTIKS